MLTIQLEEQRNKKLKTKISSKNIVKHDKICSTNISPSNLKWEDIAGLSLNIVEDDM